MRRAAFDAGLISEESSDRLELVLEPEAACIACEAENPALDNGDTLMVLDCGGGTVDITMHRVAQKMPDLILDELRSPSGGPWGSTFIDAEFETFVERAGRSGFVPQLQAVLPVGGGDARVGGGEAGLRPERPHGGGHDQGHQHERRARGSSLAIALSSQLLCFSRTFFSACRASPLISERRRSFKVHYDCRSHDHIRRCSIIITILSSFEASI